MAPRIRPICPQPVGALLLEHCRVTQEEPSDFSICECGEWGQASHVFQLRPASPQEQSLLSRARLGSFPVGCAYPSQPLPGCHPEGQEDVLLSCRVLFSGVPCCFTRSGLGSLLGTLEDSPGSP